MQNEMFQPEKPAPPPVPLSARERALDWPQRAWRPAGTVVAVLLAPLVMGHVVNGNHGLSVWRQNRAEDRELQKEINDIQQENAQLRQADRSPQIQPRRHRARGPRKTPLRQARRSHLFPAHPAPEPRPRLPPK